MSMAKRVNSPAKKKSPPRKKVVIKSPTVKRSPKERGLIVLDIDGTIIDTVSGDDKRPGRRKRIQQFEDHSIYGRPYAKQFIDWCMKKYDVGVWTFATGDYAVSVLKGFGYDPQDFVFFYTRDFPPPWNPSHDNEVKQIERIPTNHKKRVLIDDNTANVRVNEKTNRHPDIGAIQIKEYQVHKPGSSADNQLLLIKEAICRKLGD